ncbi:MAG: hypothetical protein ACTSR3_04910 [Candidatus Helarchaeota archaeon]
MKKKVILFLFIQIFTLLMISSVRNNDNLIYKSQLCDRDIFVINFSDSDPYLSWSDNGSVICQATNDQNSPKICNDGFGGVIIAWIDNRGADSDIFAQRIDSNGAIQWNVNGTIVCNEGGDQNQLQICSDGEGGAIIVWRDLRDSKVDIYAQKINSNGITQWDDNGTIICNMYIAQSEPQICSDGQGGAIIVWQDGRDFPTNGQDIYIQRIHPNGSTLWTNNGSAVCTETGDQMYPQICDDGNGGAFITWQDSRNDYDVYVQHFNSSGNATWTNNGINLSTVIAWQYSPQICKSSNNEAVVVWQELKVSDYNLFCQKINLTGAIQWTANGVAICTESGNQENPKICCDSNGNSIIIWEDKRNEIDIYAQMINSSGNIKWEVNGSAICTSSGTQSNPQLCCIGNNEIMMTWEDYRGGTWDIYVQLINSTGRVQWVENGTIVNNKLNNQNSPLICSNAIGEAIIIWEDNRSASLDIYGQNIEVDKFPSNNQPNDLITEMSGSDVIYWILYDDYGGGQYRVWVNDTNEDYHIWVSWTSWSNNSYINVPINRITTGIFNYTIEFTTITGQTASDTVFVTIVDSTQTPQIPNLLIIPQSTDLFSSPLFFFGISIGIFILIIFLLTLIWILMKMRKTNQKVNEIYETIKEKQEKKKIL